MNRIYKTNASPDLAVTGQSPSKSTFCRRCYERAAAHLGAVKAGIEQRFSRAMAGYELLLKRAVNEAEALAWQTAYPHLLFPTLAEEKAVAAQQWVIRQKELRRQAPTRVLAA